jgi:hypothetical protein
VDRLCAGVATCGPGSVLCHSCTTGPWDVEEGEFEDEGGIPAAAIRLGEAVQIPGEIPSYAYDYGDNWDLTLRLENVLPAAAGTPSAVAVDGRRAAPPEDCGGAGLRMSWRKSSHRATRPWARSTTLQAVPTGGTHEPKSRSGGLLHKIKSCD